MDNRELGILMGKALRGTTPLASLVVKQNVVAINGNAAEARKFPAPMLPTWKHYCQSAHGLRV